MLFQNALEMLGNKARQKLQANTYIERLDDDTIGVLYHRTYVVKIHCNETIELDTGGWETVTTKDRINNVLSSLFNGLSVRRRPSVFSKLGEFFLTESIGQKIEFFNHMVLNAQGRCINYWTRE